MKWKNKLEKEFIDKVNSVWPEGTDCRLVLFRAQFNCTVAKAKVFKLFALVPTCKKAKT